MMSIYNAIQKDARVFTDVCLEFSIQYFQTAK